MYPDLIDVEQELYELPQMVFPNVLVSVGWADMTLPLQERVIYNKEVQTMAVETEVPHDYEEQIRQRIYRKGTSKLIGLLGTKHLRRKALSSSRKLSRKYEVHIQHLNLL
jgi:dynein intermediate chain